MTAAAASTAQDLPLPADVRLLIDVSGSMKQTDPENLRRPALELLVRLLPEGSRAGVWTFGQEVNVLVPHGPLNQAWQEHALASVDAVNSVAMYTNIGLALDRASYDREGRDLDYKPHIILLTDGMVDVSPLDDVNQHEQRRIETQLVPELAEAGYRIHTIALSRQADRDLLQRLARGSNGIYSQADNADQLLTSLVRILHQTVPSDSLPMEDDGFLVDEEVREFTALILRPSGSPAAELLAPDGQRHTPTSNVFGTKWHHTAEYDLVTVHEPAPGRWDIDAQIEPDSRVRVLSDLSLQVRPVANHQAINQPLALEFSLRDKQETITDTQLLDLLDINVSITGPLETGSPQADSPQADSEQSQMRHVSWDRESPGDGIYRLALPDLDAPGAYRIDLVVDGKTFKRAFSHRLAVASLFAVGLNKSVASDQVKYTVTVSGNSEAIDYANTSVVAHIENSTGHTAVRALERDEENRWRLTITPEVPARYSIDLEVSGRRSDGESLRETLSTQYFTFPEEGDPYVSPEDRALADLEKGLVEQEAVATEEPPSATAPDGAEPVEPEPESESSHNWLLYSGVILTNLLVIALIFFGYRMIKSSRQTGADPSATENPEGKEEEVPSEPPPMQDIVPQAEEGEDAAKPVPEPEPAATASPEPENQDDAQDPLGGEAELKKEPKADDQGQP